MILSPVARDRLVDVAIAVGLGAISAMLVLGVVDGTAGQVIAAVLAVLHISPLLVRRRRPEAVVAAMAATAALTVPLGVPVVVLGPAALVGLYSVGAASSARRSRQLLIGVLVVSGAVTLLNGADAGTVVTNTIALTTAWWLGGRSRRAAMEADALAAKAVADERLRIARELHDVVAHAMSVIAVQAGTGRFVIERQPDVAAEALATIETTSRAALQEMRRLLAVLRNDDVPAGELLLPAPGLDDLDALADVTRDAGIEVEVVTAGEPMSLPWGLELCAYRIVQEALTNVRKHARARRATVRVTRGGDAVTIEVSDDGVGSAASTPSAGVGIVGMRERVALYGGTLEAGRAPSGYRVHARFPLGPA